MEILETSEIFFFPNTPKDANRHYLPNRSTHRPSRLPPTSKQVNNSSRHNPRHTKTIKNISPQSVSHITVKKKMVHIFPISLAKATFVHNDDMPLHEIVHSKDLAEGCRPHKKSHPRRSLSPPHTLPRETTTIRASQGFEERLGLEQTFLGRDPLEPIRTISTHVD
jgi:hypothetical protein